VTAQAPALKWLVAAALFVGLACGKTAGKSDGAGGASAAGVSGGSSNGGAGMAGGGAAATGGAGDTAGQGGVGGEAGSGGASGESGAGGVSGQAGTDPTGGNGGTGGAAGGGAGGKGGGGGTAGSGPVACTFTVSSSLSAAITTVGIVTFTTTLAPLDSAEIRFAAASGGTTMVAPVDLAQPDHRTLLLGMKGSTKYTFQIVARSGAGTCTSESASLTTGAVPAAVPKLTATIVDAAAHARGFIITSRINLGGVVIVDSDGAPVWWVTNVPDVTRAHMSWDGKDMYTVGLNGSASKISMDGSKIEKLQLPFRPNHDLTAIPGGIAMLVYPGLAVDPYPVVERADDGTLTTVVADLRSVYNGQGNLHPNAIHYWPRDDTYTVSDLNASLFVKISRRGELIWQLGGANPKDAGKFFQGVPDWFQNHGHHLLADGRFVFFNNGTNMVRALDLDTATLTATERWTYRAAGITHILGDAQWLPSGNVLVTQSDTGKRIDEIDPSGRTLATFVPSDGLGYSEFRPSLYGPPPY
jgi:hypothetical protein